MKYGIKIRQQMTLKANVNNSFVIKARVYRGLWQLKQKKVRKLTSTVEIYKNIMRINL